MNSFTLRVELLHHASQHDYEALHARLAAAGFYNFVIGVAGLSVLPPAEYHRTDNVALTTARDEAVQAIRSGLRSGLQFRVFIAQIYDWQSVGLATA